MAFMSSSPANPKVRDRLPLPCGRQAGCLGFAALDLNEIRRGARELAIALEGERKVFHRSSKKSGGE